MSNRTPSDSTSPGGKHRNDIYAENPQAAGDGTQAIPAATVVLLRDAPEPQVLMVHKTSKIAFGGMWVFPGGKIDPEDYPASGDPDLAARNAAARETKEEAGIESSPDEFVYFAHWTPPASTPKRFATWFFAAEANSHTVTIDGGEIQDHEWLSPARALARHAAGEIDLAPPTWVTLYQLSLYDSTAEILGQLRASQRKIYETRIGKRQDGVRVAMWHGDAGYPDWDADLEGPRHRLVMTPGGFLFENSVARY